MKKIILTLCCVLAITFAKAQDQFVGEIRLFAGNFPPKGWAFCQGQLLPIAQNTALFSLLGTYYGGDGKTTFALPNLQGNFAIGAGQGNGLSEIDLGQEGGQQHISLISTEIPSHTHTLNVATVNNGNSNTGDNSFINTTAKDADKFPIKNQYNTNVNSTTRLTYSGVAGSGTPVATMDPYLTLNYIIALQGVFPQRP